MAIALWLTPKPNSQINETLKSLTIGLNQLLPDSVIIEPHITITSNLAINSQADVRTVLSNAIAALGNDIELSIRFNSLMLNSKNSYFKKIYIKIDKTKNLASFAAIIREMFVSLPELKNEINAKYAAQDWVLTEFDPHLSLLYTNTTHFDNALIKTLKTRVEDYLNITDILINKENDIADNDLGWNGGILKIVNCEGPVNEWQILGSVDLH